MTISNNFQRRGPRRDQDYTRINERIRCLKVRLVDEEANQLGVVDTHKALEMAKERGYDLVEVSPQSDPP